MRQARLLLEVALNGDGLITEITMFIRVRPVRTVRGNTSTRAAAALVERTSPTGLSIKVPNLKLL